MTFGFRMTAIAAAVAAMVAAPVAAQEMTLKLGHLANDKRRARKVVDGIDYFVAEISMMADIGKSLGVVLGPRGKMPRPVPPTTDIASSLIQSSTRVVYTLRKSVDGTRSPWSTRSRHFSLARSRRICAAPSSTSASGNSRTR